MADFDIPADLLDLQRAWYAADARATDVAAGVAEPTTEQVAELAAARDERLRLTEELQGHGWWTTVEPKHKLAAKAALRTAAQQ